MDIIFSLPLPIDICNKIFIYACKSPHDDLAIGVLNHFTYTDDFLKFSKKDKNEINNIRSANHLPYSICIFD
tara:strand:- start:527 stop:742 length:216 start_codon:yes stop_codon:yes gene_type:complete